MKRGVNSKRSQISLFIILGIVIVVAIGGLVYGLKIRNEAISNEFFSSVEIRPQVENIESNVILCMHEISRDGLKQIGVQGGYYNKPGRFFDLNESFIPYYYYQGNFSMPDRDKVISELENFIEDKVNVCFDELKFEGFDLEHNRASAKVFINNTEVGILIDSSFVIQKEGKRIVFNTKNFPVSQSSALSDILEIAKYITDSHKIDSKYYCISCVEKMAEEKDVYVQNIPFADNSVLIIIGENRTSDEPYLFSFLNKYNGYEIADDFALTGEFAEGVPGSLGVV